MLIVRCRRVLRVSQVTSFSRDILSDFVEWHDLFHPIAVYQGFSLKNALPVKFTLRCADAQAHCIFPQPWFARVGIICLQLINAREDLNNASINESLASLTQQVRILTSLASS